MKSFIIKMFLDINIERSLSFAQSNEITNGKIHSKKNWLILTFDSVSQIEAEHARS